MKFCKIVCILAFSFFYITQLVAINTSYNLSINPEENGSSILGNIDITWNNENKSFLNFTWNKNSITTSSLPGFGTSLQNLYIERFQLDLLPISFQIPISKVSLRFSCGGSFVDISENTHALLEDINGSLLNPAGKYVSYFNNRNAMLFSPRVGISIGGTTESAFSFSYMGYYSPIYFLSLDQQIEYDFLTEPSSNSMSRWSFPYLEHGFTLGMTKYLRFAVEHSYQRLDFQTMDWDDTGLILIGVDDIQNINEVRLGIELLIPIKVGATQFKGGIFWINEYSSSSYWGVTNKNSKFTFRFGIEG